MSGQAKPQDSGSRFDPRTPIDPSRALVPSVVQVNEVRVRQGFWPKFRKVAAKIPFARELLSVWFSARDPETPWRAKGMMLAALAYFVLPADAIPDIITGLGYTDDAAVLFALMGVIGSSLKPRHKQAARDTLDRFAQDD